MRWLIYRLSGLWRTPCGSTKRRLLSRSSAAARAVRTAVCVLVLLATHAPPARHSTGQATINSNDAFQPRTRWAKGSELPRQDQLDAQTRSKRRMSYLLLSFVCVHIPHYFNPRYTSQLNPTELVWLPPHPQHPNCQRCRCVGAWESIQVACISERATGRGEARNGGGGARARRTPRQRSPLQRSAAVPVVSTLLPSISSTPG
jgi:hypothetical protein